MNKQRIGAPNKLAKYRPSTPIGYRGPFRNMSDIYQEYRKTLMNRGPYKAYFESRSSHGEPSKKFTKTEHSREPIYTKGERELQQQHEIQQSNPIETKTEIEIEDSQKIETPKETEDLQKIETKQDTETSQKIEQEELETEEELLQKKLGLSELYQNSERQTDITNRNRPSPYHDKAETRW